LVVDQKKNEGLSAQEIFQNFFHQRNIVKEMIAELKAIKPIRQPLTESQTVPEKIILFG